MDGGVGEGAARIEDPVERALDPVPQALTAPLRAAPRSKEGTELLEPAHLLEPPHVPRADELVLALGVRASAARLRG